MVDSILWPAVMMLMSCMLGKTLNNGGAVGLATSQQELQYVVSIML